MTHEYVVATGGLVLTRLDPAAPDARPGSTSRATEGRPADVPPFATAIAWAADTILAIGADREVRSISRGDSQFLDLGGAVVTPNFDDPPAWIRLSPSSGSDGLPGGGADLLTAVRDGWPRDGRRGLEAGDPADLAFWVVDRHGAGGASGPGLRRIATLRSGHFTEGDRHRGPF